MILGIDSSSPRLSLALRHAGRTLKVIHRVVPFRQDEQLLPQLQELLTASGHQPKDLEGIAVGLGPGSFTGLRVGIAAGLGLAQALDLPIAGVPSFQVIASAGQAEQCVVLGDARQGLVYVAAYARQNGAWLPRWPEALARPAELDLGQLPGVWQVTGPWAEPGFALLQRLRPEWTLAPEADRWPDAGRLAELAETKLRQGGTPWSELTPLYLRRTQAEEMQRPTGPTV